MKTFNRLSISLMATALLAAALPAVAGSPLGVCQAGGVNQLLTGTMSTYWSWYFGGQSGPQEIGPLFLVPLPNGTPIENPPPATVIFQGEQSFNVRVGKSLVLPISFFIGESYNNGSPPDDPANVPVDYRDSSLLLTLDGKVLVDSTRTKLDCVYVDVYYFPEPIVYPEPSSYGSDAAIWMMGLGILLPPMSPGAHTIDMQVVSPTAPVFGVDLGYYNTWYVTVVNK